MAKNNTLLYVGGAVAAYLLLSSKSTAAPGTATTTNPVSSLVNSLLGTAPATAVTTTTAGTYVVPGAPAAPASFDQTYYLTYEYPAMLAANPNVGNASYTLTDAEAQQYINNYYDLQTPPGILNSWGCQNNVLGVTGCDILSKARVHWKQYGVAQRRSFMPFSPIDSAQPTIAPVNPAAKSSSGGGFFGGLASLVTSAVPIVTALAGVPPGDPTQLSNEEASVIINGAAIAKDILPFYYGAKNNVGMLIEDRLNDVLKTYVV